jgi:hypothetical protein
VPFPTNVTGDGWFTIVVVFAKFCVFDIVISEFLKNRCGRCYFEAEIALPWPVSPGQLHRRKFSNFG